MLLSYSTNNIRYLLNSLPTLIVLYSSNPVKLGCIFLLFCHFCLIYLQVQVRISLKFPYEHVELFSMGVESSIVIGQQLRELACNWPAAA